VYREATSLPDVTPYILLEYILADLFLFILFHPEDGSSALIGNFGKLQPHYVAPDPGSWYSSWALP
jgi:hypothetical protein